jgi:hypothetical protein
MVASLSESMQQFFNLPLAYSCNVLGCQYDIHRSYLQLAYMYINGLYAPRDLSTALMHL